MATTLRGSRASASLPSGRHSISRAHVFELQRGRMITALLEAVAENGYPALSVGAVIGRARVSRKTFYDIFEDREDCFLAAFDQVIEDMRVKAASAYNEGSSWREGVRAALASILIFMDQERGLARVCVVDTLRAGEAVLERRARVLDQLARVVDRARTVEKHQRDPPSLAAEAVVGGVVSVLHDRLTEYASTPLLPLLGPLMSMIVLPYLGEGAARAELNAPCPPVQREEVSGPPAGGTDALKDLNLRLTYRTVRVLMVLAQRPDASNREVAEASGVVDQGQISKLLNRLAGLGLVENHGAGQAQGKANAWRLTKRGVLLERATRPR